MMIVVCLAAGLVLYAVPPLGAVAVLAVLLLTGRRADRDEHQRGA